MNEKLIISARKKREIASGNNRAVYDLSHNSVLKLALSKSGVKSNKTEVKIYKYARKLRKYLGEI
ncbi:hypothetical protein [Paenibacillus sp. R14(2021)]|uniref:hypothetical protein n=1 Tax=Paenibacillus sp. R14(2021) TaxID=2859228 RepID=UPI001C61467E|nr:hypothetical protein [Paenibacillus sp. R14(2021)]